MCRFVFRSTDGSNSGGQSISRPFQDHGNIRHSKWTDTSLSFLEYHAMQLKNLGTLAASIQHSSRARRHGPLIFSQPATPIHAAYTSDQKLRESRRGGKKSAKAQPPHSGSSRLTRKGKIARKHSHASPRSRSFASLLFSVFHVGRRRRMSPGRPTDWLIFRHFSTVQVHKLPGHDQGVPLQHLLRKRRCTVDPSY